MPPIFIPGGKPTLTKQIMSTEITPEQVAEAKKNGQAVLYSAPGKPVRILSKEETQKMDDNWDEEYCCPKKLAELYRKVREHTALSKKYRENP